MHWGFQLVEYPWWVGQLLPVTTELWIYISSKLYLDIDNIVHEFSHFQRFGILFFSHDRWNLHILWVDCACNWRFTEEIKKKNQNIMKPSKSDLQQKLLIWSDTAWWSSPPWRGWSVPAPDPPLHPPSSTLAGSVGTSDRTTCSRWISPTHAHSQSSWI